jgi:hypothetical protein
MRMIAATLFALMISARPLSAGEAPRDDQKPTAPAKAGKPDPFAAIRALEGHWRGTGEGEPGKSRVDRTYQFVLGGRFLQARNHSDYPPQDKNPNGEKHEDWGMFSFDNARKKLILRQFHLEGFVNQYVLERVSTDGREVVFVTEAIENIPRGFRARESYKLIDSTSFEETFEIAAPGKDFAIYCVNKFKRAK